MILKSRLYERRPPDRDATLFDLTPNKLSEKLPVASSHGIITAFVVGYQKGYW